MGTVVVDYTTRLSFIFQHSGDADMIFVKNFTQPDFQAKSFALQKCIICHIFLTNCHGSLLSISILYLNSAPELINYKKYPND